MTERDEALKLANRVLDRPSGDPDDDMAVLARALLRERDTTYLIWSNEKKGWMMPGSEWAWSDKLTDAGGYSRSAAMAICANSIPEAMLRGNMVVPNLPVRLADVQEFIKGRLAPENK